MDNLALLPSHTPAYPSQDQQTANIGLQVGLQISTKKTGAMILNVDIPAPVKVNGEELCKCILKLYFN